MTKKSSKRRLPVMLMALLFAATVSISSVSASDITGVTGSGGVFNIDPAGQINHNGQSIGFREYTAFTLDAGDTANLKFDSGINSFVNMVTNQININGVVNTVKAGAFHNGEAVFVSPNGMVVGPSGVLNVGSLGVYTPTPQGMKMLKDGFQNGTMTATYKGKEINLLDGIGWHGNAPVTINGKINAQGGVDLVANQFTLGSSGEINSLGETLFSALVNFDRNNGNDAGVNIRSYDRQGNGFMKIDGKINNTGASDIIIQNRGSQGLSVNNGAEIKAANGDLYLVNSKGAMNVAGKLEDNGGKVYLTNGQQGGAMNFTGKIKGGAEIYNRSAAGANIAGEINNGAKGLAITSEKGVLTLDGDIKSTGGNVFITNQGSKLVLGENSDIAGNQKGKLQISSKGADGMELNGKVSGFNKTAITNHKGKLTVNGEFTNYSSGKNNSKFNITQKGDGGLELSDTSIIDNNGSEVLIQNVGKGGFTASGEIGGGAPIYLQNAKNAEGAMVVDGKIENSGNVIYVGNTSKGGLEIAESAEISNQDGAIKIVNFAGNLDDKGQVSNNNGDIYITNKGDGGLNITDTATLGADKGKLVVQNFGKEGMTVDGEVSNKGYTALYNRAGDMNINSDVTTIGARMNIQNSGDGALNINDTAALTNEGMGRTYITNKGNGGMNIDADVVGGGHVIVTNRKGGMNVHSKVTSTKANVVLTNTGEKNMVVDGTVRGNKVTAYAKGNDIVLGNTDTNQIAINGLKKVSITTDDGSILNAGVDTHLIKSGGNIYMHANNGTIGTEPAGGIGENARDLTKSINVVANGKIKAFTTDPGMNGTINIASKGHDLKVDRIKADGKVFLLTDKYVDEAGVVHTGSILNRGTELDNYANVKGTSINLISSGSIGTFDRPLHYRQTNPAQASDVLAAKDIYMHHRGNESGEYVNFGVIKSKEGSINVDTIGDGYVGAAVAPGAINITPRKQGSNLNVNYQSKDPNVIRDYFDGPTKTATTAGKKPASDAAVPEDEPEIVIPGGSDSNEEPTEPTASTEPVSDPIQNALSDWYGQRPDDSDTEGMADWLSEMPTKDPNALKEFAPNMSDEDVALIEWFSDMPDNNSGPAFTSWIMKHPETDIDLIGVAAAMGYGLQ